MVFVFQKYIYEQPKPEQAKDQKLQGKYVVDPSQLMAWMDNPAFSSKINLNVAKDISSFFDKNDLNKGKAEMVTPFTRGEIREKIVKQIYDRIYDPEANVAESKKNFTAETGYPATREGGSKLLRPNYIFRHD